MTGWGEEDGNERKERKKGRERKMCPTDLGGVDSALLEGTAGGVVGAQVAVLAPVAAEGTVHT